MPVRHREYSHFGLLRSAFILSAATGLAGLSPALEPPAFTVEAEQGEYDGWEGSPDGLVAVKARVAVLRLGPDGKWLPGVSEVIGHGTNRIGLGVWSHTPGAALRVEVVHYRNGEEVERSVFKMAADPILPFDLEMRWTREGSVCLSFSQSGKSEARMIALGEPPSTLALNGSGGAFRFDPVVLIAESPKRDRAADDLALKASCSPIS